MSFSLATLSRNIVRKSIVTPKQPSRFYHERVIDHYEKPRNVGSLPKEDPNVGTGLVGAPACGDVMKLQIKVDDKGIITESCFKTFGCGSAIASSSFATELIKGKINFRPILDINCLGKHIDDAVNIKNTDIAKHLALPPVKMHCSMLAGNDHYHICF
jgi:Fe-S cluster assembly scaffold IscU